jgi:hypothetical protein
MNSEAYFIERIVVANGVAGLVKSDSWEGLYWGEQSALRELVLPDSILSIRDLDLGSMTRLTTVSVGVNFDADWDESWWPNSLTTFVVPPQNTHLTVDTNGVLLSKDGTVLYLYPPGRTNKQYTIPQTVTKIAVEAFSYALNLESVTFSAVKVIEAGAFENCENLILTALPNSLEYLGDLVFEDCSNITSLALGPLVTLGVAPFPTSLQSFTVSPQHPDLIVDSTGVLLANAKTDSSRSYPMQSISCPNWASQKHGAIGIASYAKIPNPEKFS